jgi:protein gp37
MGNKTAIGWTHRTMNPIGVKDSKTFHCVKRSPACNNCYAEVMARRLAAMGKTTFYPYKKLKVMPELALNRRMLRKWAKTKKPYLNFVTSMSDLFGEFVPKEWTFEILDAMIEAHKQVFQCLTKREDIMYDRVEEFCKLRGIDRLPDNIWLGMTVESQKYYDLRSPFLYRSRCSVRWLSMEPLLGPVDLALSGTVPKDWGYGYVHISNLLHWVVVGGESGFPSKTRPTHPEWFRSLRDQCKADGVPFFFKQVGCWAPIAVEPAKGDKGHYAFGWPTDGAADMPKFMRPEKLGILLSNDTTVQWMKWMQKKEAGELLDGIEHKEFPEITEILLNQ